MRRLLRKHGDLRISEGAAEELRAVVGEYGSKVAEAAIAHALGEGRKTVLDRDVREAKLTVEGAVET
ncbi:histone [Candidatus Bathyarchaeota archaeon]|nr:MAG: histone [Candidatus Bathyarchaeota archaeon]